MHESHITTNVGSGLCREGVAGAVLSPFPWFGACSSG